MKKYSVSDLLLRGITILAIAGAFALVLLTRGTSPLQTGLLQAAQKAVAVIVGESSFLIAWTPLLLKMLYFMALALLLWSVLLLKGTNRRSALVGGIATVVIVGVVLEVLQFVVPGHTPSVTDFLWSAGSGCFVSLFLFAGQWAWDRFPSLVNRETVLYVIFGAITTIVNIVSFQFCFNLLQIPTLISNAIAWVLSVLVAYVTNKLFVFQSKNERFSQFVREIALFFGARLLSFGIDELGMWLMVDVAHINGGLSKIAMNVVVLILNYIFSKWFIFSSKKEAAPPEK